MSRAHRRAPMHLRFLLCIEGCPPRTDVMELGCCFYSYHTDTFDLGLYFCSLFHMPFLMQIHISLSSFGDELLYIYVDRFKSSDFAVALRIGVECAH